MLESLSALVDGEASELELHRILKSFSDDEQLQNSWLRYNVIRSVLAKDSLDAKITGAFPETSMLASIRKALDGDEVHSNSVNKLEDETEQHALVSNGGNSRQPWQAWFGKSALAASVCAAFVIGLGQMNGLKDQEHKAVLASNVENMNSVAEPAGPTTLAAPLGFELPAVESRTVSVNSQPSYSPSQIVVRNPLLISSDSYSDLRAQEMLNQLHILHAERASANGGLGMMPFARLSDMDARSQPAQ